VNLDKNDIALIWRLYINKSYPAGCYCMVMWSLSEDWW